MESRTYNSKRNITFGIICSLALPASGFLVKTAIIRCFSIEYLGLTSVLASILQVLNMAELGFSSAIVVNLYEPIKQNNVIGIRSILRYYRSIYRIIGAIILVLGLLFLPFYPNFLGEKNNLNVDIYVIYIIYLANTVISYFLFAYKEAMLNAVQRFDITKRVFLFTSLLRDICQLIALVVLRNFYLFSIILLISTVIYSVIIQLVSKKKYKEYYPDGIIEKETRKNIKEQIAGLSIGKVLEVSRNSFDTLIISAFLGLTIVGQYNNYYYVYSVLINIAWVVINAIQSSVGNSIVSETKEKNFSDLLKMESLYSIGLSIGTACLLTMYQPFMSLWMGNEMLFDNSIMILFVIYFYVMGINGVRNAYFFALGLWWKAKWLLISEAASNLLLNILLGKLFGVYGVLFATIITIVLLNYFGITRLLFQEYFKSGFTRFIKNRLISTMITVLACISSYLICSMITISGFLNIVCRGAITCIISTGIVVGFLYYFWNEQFVLANSFFKNILTTRRK